MDSSLISFIIFCLVMTLTPGANMALVTKNTLHYSKQAGIATTFGISFGLLCYSILTASGLAYIIASNRHLYLLIKHLAVAYLFYLGIKAFYSALHKNLFRFSKHQHQKLPSSRKLFLEGFITNLLNPNIIIFYLSVIPQFIPIEEVGFISIFSYALIHTLMGLTWLYCYCSLLKIAEKFLLSPAVRATLETASGLVMILLGCKILLDIEYNIN